jgi:hypothetical protein
MSFKSNGEGPDKIVTIDCGGIIFRTFARTLQKIPKSRLCKLAEEGSPLMQSGYIFFDRNPIVFAAIMEYYRWIAAVVVPVCLSVNVNVNACDVFTTVLSRIQHVFLLSLSAAYAGIRANACVSASVVCMRENRHLWTPYRRTERLEKPVEVADETW